MGVVCVCKHRRHPRVRLTDSAGLSSNRALTITVGDVNEAPAAVADAISVDEDATSDNLWSLLLSNDGDVDAGDLLTISAVDGSGTLGSLVFDSATRTLRYVADNDAFDALAPGATASDSFSYTVTDADGLSHSASVTVTVTGIADGISLGGGNGNDLLEGTSGEDRLSGGNGDDRLFGLAGHDRLEGGRGDDLLDGGSGADLLIGGKGNDRLIGGAGADLFVFGALSGNDVILDYTLGEDRLSFEADTAVRSSRTLDANGDGVTDLMLVLTGGGSVVLLGVSSLADVSTATAPPTDGSAQPAWGWAASGDQYELMALGRLSNDHFVY